MRAGKTVRAVIVVLAIVAAVVVVRQRPMADARPATSTPHGSSASSTSSTGPASATAAEGRRGDAPWERTARSFIDRYPNTTGGKTAWLARLRPVVSDDLHRSLKTVRLTNLPAGDFGPGEVKQIAEVGGVMRFPLRGGDVKAVDITVSVSDEGRLRVTAIDPVGV